MFGSDVLIDMGSITIVNLLLRTQEDQISQTERQVAFYVVGHGTVFRVVDAWLVEMLMVHQMIGKMILGFDVCLGCVEK